VVQEIIGVKKVWLAVVAARTGVIGTLKSISRRCWLHHMIIAELRGETSLVKKRTNALGVNPRVVWAFKANDNNIRYKHMSSWRKKRELKAVVVDRLRWGKAITSPDPVSAKGQYHCIRFSFLPITFSISTYLQHKAAWSTTENLFQPSKLASTISLNAPIAALLLQSLH
jgi:hypothetical protein